MIGTALEVSDMKIEVSICGGIDIPMQQVAPVVVTCVMDGSKVSKVYADEGISFLSEGGFVGLDYKAGMEITEICDRAEFGRKLRAKQVESDEMKLHTGQWPCES